MEDIKHKLSEFIHLKREENERLVKDVNLYISAPPAAPFSCFVSHFFSILSHTILGWLRLIMKPWSLRHYCHPDVHFCLSARDYHVLALEQIT